MEHYDEIMSCWLKFWKTIGDFFFYPWQGPGGYMDGPRSLCILCLIVLIFGIIFGYKITERDRRTKKFLIKILTKRIKKYNMTIEDAKTEISLMYYKYFPQSDYQDDEMQELIEEVMLNVFK